MKKKIVIASVLKPVDDVRSFWKFSQSLAKTNKYEVNIIGNATKNEIEFPNVSFTKHSISRGEWLKRYFIRFKILYRIVGQKPSLLIVTDHELVSISIFAKVFTGCKTIYDVQEDYYKNLTYINPSPLKKIYARVIRLIEYASRPFVSEYWLAEKCYENELSFVRKKSLVVENKAYKISGVQRSRVHNELLFTGTISRYSRIDLALNIFKKLIEKKPDITIKIVGQVHDECLRKYLIKEAESFTGITLLVSENPVPHSQIIQAILTSTVGIISYQPNEVNRHKIPTKLYEYSRYQLPYLIQENTHWSTIGNELEGAIPIDFNNISSQKLLEIIFNLKASHPETYAEEATWEFESKKIITSIERLIKNK